LPKYDFVAPPDCGSYDYVSLVFDKEKEAGYPRDRAWTQANGLNTAVFEHIRTADA
jgi:hypothetical protein